MAIEIRRVGIEDAAILDRVADGVFDEKVTPDRLAAYLAESNHHIIVAIEDGEVVGQCMGVVIRHPDKPAELFVDEVGVTPGRQHQGIGRTLLGAMLALGRDEGCAEAWVGTEPGNIAARRLYEAAGGGTPESFVLYTIDLG